MTDVKKNGYDKGQNFAVSIGKEVCPFRRNGTEEWVGGGGVAQVGEDASNPKKRRKKKEEALVVVSFAGFCGARGKT